MMILEKIANEAPPHSLCLSPLRALAFFTLSHSHYRTQTKTQTQT